MEKRFLELCLEAGLSLPAIGRLTGKLPGTVGYWVKKHGLEANGSAKFSQRGPIDRAVLEEMIDAGLTLREMADRLGTNIKRVHYWVQKHGLKTTGGKRIVAIRLARAEGRSEVMLECPTHGATPFWLGRTGVRCRQCNADGVAKRRRRVKEILVEEAGGACRRCGFNEAQVALEFHHLDPAVKSFGISAAGVTRSLDRQRAEAAKCVLLCANCHAMVEAGVAEVPVE